MVGGRTRAIVTRSETEDIHEDLKAKLVSGVLAPGMKLKPADLQGEYGCSANTVRDVLMRLVNLGLHAELVKKYANRFSKTYRSEYRKLELAGKLARFAVPERRGRTVDRTVAAAFKKDR